MQLKSILSHSLASLLLLSACGGDDGGGGGGGGESFDNPQIVSDYADQVIIPTYELLADRAEALDTAANDLAADTTAANLEAARDAWVATREPWESGEAFIFGPVEAFGYDPSLDTWPLNRTDLQAVLDSTDDLTPDYVASLAETLKGFHAIEFLLFDEGGLKEAGDFTPRELEYLTALTAGMVSITSSLETAWTDGTGGDTAFRDVFAGAGEDGNTVYPSLSAAGQEMVNGMSGICDEVANGKIADPYDAQDPNLVESQFSYNSLTDFQNNIRSVQNAYTGEVQIAGTSGLSLSSYVASVDAELDSKVKQQISDAIDAIGAIPAPFRDAITDSEASDEIEAAQAAIRTVQDTLDGEVLPLLQ